MKKEEITLRQDIKTAWVGGCKDLVGWLQSFGKPKTNLALEKELSMMATMERPERVRGEDRRKTDRGNDRRFNKFGEPEEPKRSRGKKGRYLADDPTTKDVNEAWVGGKAPKRGKKNDKKI